MKKRIMALLMAGTMIFSMAACGTKTATTATETTTAPAAATNAAAPAQTAGTDATTAAAADTAAGSDTAATAPADAADLTDNSITVGIATDPTDLGPWGPRNDGSLTLRRDFYESVFEKTAAGFEPLLASGYEQIDDITFDATLFDYIYDNAGNHLTASDVVFSYDTYHELQPNSMNELEYTEVISDYVVRFHIREGQVKAGTIEKVLTEIAIVTKAAYEADGNGMKLNPIGTGRYVVTQYVPGASITAQRAESYWQKDAFKLATYSHAYPKEIKWVIIPEPAQIAIALQTGTIDIASGIPDADMVNFVNPDGTAKEGFSAAEIPNKKVYALFYNCRDRDTANLAVRQAICYAIDAQAIALSTFGSLGKMSHNVGTGLYPDYDLAYDSKPYFEQDVAKAKELLASAGYKDGDITLSLVYEGTAEKANMAQLIQAYLGQVGITVELNGLDAALVETVVRNDAGDWDIYLNWVNSNDFLVTGLFSLSANAMAFDLGQCMVKDEKLEELFAVGINPHTFGVAATSAIVDHVQENCMVYGMFTSNTQAAASGRIKDIVCDYREFVRAESCTFK